jgi:hypothetical protein
MQLLGCFGWLRRGACGWGQPRTKLEARPSSARQMLVTTHNEADSGEFFKGMYITMKFTHLYILRVVALTCPGGASKP